MNGDQPDKVTNNLVQLTRAAGLAVKAGDMTQLKDCVRALGAAGGSFANSGRESLGNKPAQLPHLTRKAGGQEGTPHRAIQQDRPAQGHSR